MPFVWSHFDVSLEDASITICRICGTNIKRGVNCKSYVTSPLQKHLNTRHHRIFLEAKKASSRNEAVRSSSTLAQKIKTEVFSFEAS